MALPKQVVNFNFSGGLDLKSDPWQVPLGKFLALTNSVFTTGGLLEKRNGFGFLPALPDATFSYLTTFNGTLTALGNRLEVFNRASASWFNKGSIQPVKLSTLPLIRNSLNQLQCDTAVSPLGSVCVVYSQNDVVSGQIVKHFYYAIEDSTTGQNIIAPTQITSISESPRVFLLGNYFVILYSSSANLNYIAIPVNNPSAPLAPTTLITNYSSGASSLAFDGIVANNNLFIAYNASDGGGAVRLTYMNSFLTRQTTITGVVLATTHVATLVSICADITLSPPTIYINFYAPADNKIYITAIQQTTSGITTVLALTNFSTAFTVVNLASSVQNQQMELFYEDQEFYTYDSTTPNNQVWRTRVNQSGSLGDTAVIYAGAGLASKSVALNSHYYVLLTYQSTYQPTYFLGDSLGKIVAKLGYENAGGYLSLGLPSLSLSGTVLQVPYLFKDLITSVNKDTNVASGTQTAGIYSQLGINLASFDITASGVSTAEIGNNLNITGGFLWSYDGFQPVEQNFFLYPDNVKATYNASTTVTPTGTFSSGSTSVVVSSASGISVGMSISDTTNPTYISTGTFVTAVNGTTLSISQATTHSAAGDTLSIAGNVVAKPDTSTNTNAYFYQVTYEWTDQQGNVFRSAPSIPVSVTTSGAGTAGTITVHVPTCRLTYKSNVKVVIYRWSVKQQAYYQTTSVSLPVISDPSVDSITFIDANSDATILGNELIYTTGGVVEDIGPPAFNAVSLFKSRLFGIDSEDGTIWFSKQVIQGTAVEMSDLFTLYLAPTIGAQGSTGITRCLFPMDDKMIFFKENGGIYYLTGNGPDNTGANSDFSDFTFITSTLGCNNQASIVFIPDGIMFEDGSGKGIWLLGRDLSTSYIGADVDAFNSAQITSAFAIPQTTQVRFTLSSGIMLQYDYFYKQWETFSNNNSSTVLNAVSSCLFEDLHTYINVQGQCFQETPGLYVDGSLPVLMSWTTSWLKVSHLQNYQRVYDLYLLAKFISPHKIAMSLAYDFSPAPQQQSVISPNNYSAPYGGDESWGSGPTWGGNSALEQWRVHTQRQTCEAIQISMSELYDASYGVPAGAGFTMSGVQARIGLKKSTRPIPAKNTVG